MKKYLCTVIICITICKTLSAQSWNINGNNLNSAGKLGSINNVDVRIITNNNPRITIKANGKIGIGIAAPQYKLDIAGTVRITKGSGTGIDSPQIVIDGAGNNNQVIQFQNNGVRTGMIGFDGSRNGIILNANALNSASFSMSLGSNGNLGVGTFSPQAKLHVFGNEILDGDLTMASTLGKGDINFTTDQQNIAFATPGTSSSPMIVMSSNTGSTNTRMVFSKSLGSEINTGMQYIFGSDKFNFIRNSSSKFTVDLLNGRIGINNSSPTYTIDAVGNSRISGNLGVQSAPTIKTIQCGTSQGALIGIGSAEYIQDAGISTLSVAAALTPTTDNGFSLGNGSFRWNALYAVNGTIQTSDARDKTNIRDLNYGLKEIMQLHAVKFDWKNDAAEGDKLGVIAQEIKKVLPEVVRDWEYTVDETTGKKTKVPAQRLGVIYTDIIPVLIKGMQELSKQNDALQKQIDDLKTMLNSSSTAGSNQNVQTYSANNGRAVSLQNIPNPVKDFTIIHYNTGINKNAQLNITNIDGKIIKKIQLNANTSSVNVDCSSFAPGTYYYTLTVDNVAIASNKMIVAK